MIPSSLSLCGRLEMEEGIKILFVKDYGPIPVTVETEELVILHIKDIENKSLNLPRFIVNRSGRFQSHREIESRIPQAVQLLCRFAD